MRNEEPIEQPIEMKQLLEVEVHENMPFVRTRRSKIHDLPIRTPSDKLQNIHSTPRITFIQHN
jgi:hypothetical protein